MTEFNLTNGQAIELTKDGILFKGNRIEIEGNVTVVKDDKHANIVEQDDERTKISIVTIDDEAKITEPDAISYGRLAALETKLSTAMTEIDNLKKQSKLNVH